MCKDALGVCAVVIRGLVAAAAEFEGIESAAGCGAGPLGVAEVGVAHAESAQGGDLEERGQGQPRAEVSVRGDVVVAEHDGDEGVGTEELGRMDRGTCYAIKGEISEVGDGRGDADSETFASVWR